MWIVDELLCWPCFRTSCCLMIAHRNNTVCNTRCNTGSNRTQQQSVCWSENALGWREGERGPPPTTTTLILSSFLQIRNWKSHKKNYNFYSRPMAINNINIKTLLIIAAFFCIILNLLILHSFGSFPSPWVEAQSDKSNGRISKFRKSVSMGRRRICALAAG